jgi:hypothetical protein
MKGDILTVDFFITIEQLIIPKLALLLRVLVNSIAVSSSSIIIIIIIIITTANTYHTYLAR